MSIRMLVLAAALASASTLSAQEIGEYVTDDYFVDWALDNPVICYDRDVAANACGSVMTVDAGDAKRLQTTGYSYDAGVKTVISLDYLVQRGGICFTVPTADRLDVRMYFTGNAIAEIGPNDVAEPLSVQALTDIANTVFATEGIVPGDQVCARYRVGDRNDREILSLEEEVWVNGVLDESWSGSTVHFFLPDTVLGLLTGKR